jgi:hypothetical protein
LIHAALRVEPSRFARSTTESTLGIGAVPEPRAATEKESAVPPDRVQSIRANESCPETFSM